MNKVKDIENGKTTLGIEFGSTRIKSVLLNEQLETIATGNYEWENMLKDGFWTYSLEEIWKGLQESYLDLKKNVEQKYSVYLRTVGAIGVSAMQHGYMVFDEQDNQLVPFRTWRNTTTSEAAGILTELFKYPIPQRWSVAHLYQAMLNKEEHVNKISCLTTLAGYVHWQLTGNKVVGLNEASGMFPIDLNTLEYDAKMLRAFDKASKDMGYRIELEKNLPDIVEVGEIAGTLSEKGGRLLDKTGMLQPGVPFCPPEGDGATGMISTNSITPGIGNISAGTSAFAMIVLNGDLKNVHSEIDQVVTPDGNLVAMIHCNNCTSDLNAWVSLFKEFAQSVGVQINQNDLFGVLYNKALESDFDGGGMLAYNYISGEHIVGIEEGRAMFLRTPNSNFNLANFMKTNLFAALATVKIGMDILIKDEEVVIEKIIGHGGLFKTKQVGQQIVADALNVPVETMSTAGEGGAWGIAVLAAYMKNKNHSVSLKKFLEKNVFGKEDCEKVLPNPESRGGFEKFMIRFTEGMEIQKVAIKSLK